MAIMDGEATRSLSGPREMTLGTMYFGTTVPEAIGVDVLDEAFDLGVRTWDTANNYAFWVPGGTGGESEECLGRWFAAHPGRRDDIFLSTKVGARPRHGSKNLADAVGLSPTAIRGQLHASLARLGTDRVDLLYAHIDDETVPLAETIGAMEELRDEGLVGEIGASNLPAPRLREAIDAASGHDRGYRFLQQRFTFLNPAVGTDLSPHVLLDDAVAAECAAGGITMLGYSPLLSGAYTRPDRPLPDGYDTPANREALAVLAQVAGRSGLDSGQTVLAWMAQRATGVLPVVGVSSIEQLRSAATAVKTTLPQQDIHALEAVRMAG
ncbi:aldo/keto reductase [Isoptericola croceus]|uniref:aldo/keto reductase n=1 Tax=Isoptericola croceus TaxID=3031406 RepID=UPI0023F85023|nr:aldo/keto reductase [Isoptericola croceus]